MPRFESFVLFAEMRTGSNFLEANLNALDGVTSHGEVFNPHFIGRKDQTELMGMSIATRDADPVALLRRMRELTRGLSGFRYFHDHDPRVLDVILNDWACAKIILTRNPVDSYVSLLIARATGQWKLTDAKRLKSAKVRFDPAEFEAHLMENQAFQLVLMQGLQTTGQTAFYIDYEDLSNLQVLNGLAAFLGVDARLKSVDDTLKKQNPQSIEAKIDNVDEMRAALARMDRFNLSRTPNFEPRRAAGVPTAIAAADAPLLFLPIRSAPDAEIRAWLGTLGTGGVTEGFEQKSLRHWKRTRAGHRSFTVVRHPLLRAYAAFRDLIVTGRLADHRRHLIRAYKADLPEIGDDFPDLKAEHAAFLIFLHFAKLNAAGQTGLRVDPNWASQTAIIQGFAGFHPPDLVIREDRLDEGLSFLAAEVGLAAGPCRRDDDHAHQLRRIQDQSLEAAAAEAYPRDYVGFGFGPLNP